MGSAWREWNDTDAVDAPGAAARDRLVDLLVSTGLRVLANLASAAAELHQVLDDLRRELDAYAWRRSTSGQARALVGRSPGRPTDHEGPGPGAEPDWWTGAVTQPLHDGADLSRLDRLDGVGRRSGDGAALGRRPADDRGVCGCPGAAQCSCDREPAVPASVTHRHSLRPGQHGHVPDPAAAWGLARPETPAPLGHVLADPRAPWQRPA